MATIDITPPAGTANSEGQLQNTNNQTFANARANTDGQLTLSNPTGEAFYFLGGNAASDRKLIRHFFKADFSSVPLGTITAVTFNFNARYSYGNADETSVLALGAQSNTLATGNWAAFTTDYGRFVPASSSSALYSLSLNASGISDISNRGTTKFCFTGIYDFDNVTPSDGGTQGNTGPIWHTPSDSNSGLVPYFTVTYTPPPPSISGSSYASFM